MGQSGCSSRTSATQQPLGSGFLRQLRSSRPRPSGQVAEVSASQPGQKSHRDGAGAERGPQRCRYWAGAATVAPGVLGCRPAWGRRWSNLASDGAGRDDAEPFGHQSGDDGVKAVMPELLRAVQPGWSLMSSGSELLRCRGSWWRGLGTWGHWGHRFLPQEADVSRAIGASRRLNIPPSQTLAI
jgi:hypothetical protein